MSAALSGQPRVCLVAGPLIARSGVYRSARELVECARQQGLPWSLILAMAPEAGERTDATDPDWISERTVAFSGLSGVRSLARYYAARSVFRDSDLAISLNPQTDMALSLGRKPWVAYLRGLPWPAHGEATEVKRMSWQVLERAALRRAHEVWASTSTLKSEAALRRDVVVVPAGIATFPRTWDGSGDRNEVVWAGRMDTNKNGKLFQKAMGDLVHRGIDGVMYGAGPLAEELSATNPSNVRFGGWVKADALWDQASMYVGTSFHEAFGRSAVEAAMAGIPVVISRSFGCADLLVSDAAFREMFVLDPADKSAWSNAIRALHEDESLRMKYSDHVHTNAMQLTIEASVARMSESAARVLRIPN